MNTTRRKFISGSSLVVLSSLAGCASALAQRENKKEVLEQVFLKNQSDTPYNVEYKIEGDDNLIDSGVCHLSPRDEEGAEKEVLDRGEEYKDSTILTVSARIDDGERERAKLQASQPANCHNVEIIIEDREWDRLTVLPNECI